MAFAIKTEVRDPLAKSFVCTAQKTMYGGKHIAKGDTVFLFASENEGGRGLVARGAVTSAEPIAKKGGVARQTPCVSIAVNRTALAKRPLGRSELKQFTDWNDGQPETAPRFAATTEGCALIRSSRLLDVIHNQNPHRHSCGFEEQTSRLLN